MTEQGEEKKTPKRRGGLTISPLTFLTGFGVLGLISMSLIYVATGFVLDESEKKLAESFGILPNNTQTPLSVVVPGDWSDACILNTPIKDPGKVKKPTPMPGMLIPPMRHHANFLKSGYWIIVTLDGKGNVAAEYRVDPKKLSNLSADNGKNFCAPRKVLQFALQRCSGDCTRKIVFDR